MRVSIREIPELEQGDPMGVVAWAWKLRLLLKKIIEWIDSIDGGGIVPPPDGEFDWCHRWKYATLTWADYTIADDWACCDVGLYCPTPSDGDTKTITLPEPGAGKWMTLTLFFQITGAWTAGSKYNIADPNGGTLFSGTAAEMSVPFGIWKSVYLTSYLDNDGATWMWQYAGTVRVWNETTDTTLP